MAKGYPDFFGFSIFPQKGFLSHENPIGENVVGAIENYSILSVSSKGEVLAGIVYCAIVAGSSTATVKLFVDGDEIDSRLVFSTGYLGPYNRETPVYLIERDKLRGRSKAKILPGITFTDSLELKVDVGVGFTVNFTSDLWYYQLV